ncbi:hypothetical protein H6A30_04540 [Bacteroides caecigallinarum]|uniref:hypothetical protein n=1 Tax=Bacteroides caecigallinarum TaxID=1411144 RepID=UPI00195A385C|nr:hypothetical protein [Bacteroides caecigallinarum]MBM6889563.1 hypothetical protein [Bacteroides caecigallinarum]
MNRFKTLIVRFSIAIFILCGFVSLYSQDIKEKRLWLVELNGALTSQSSWEVEPSITFLPIDYVGLTAGLVFTSPYPSRSLGGVAVNKQFRWSETNDNSVSYFFAFRPALRLNSPKLWIGRDKDYALYLSVSPGLTIPLPSDRRFTIDYFPNKNGAWSALKREEVANSGARKVYYNVRTAVSLEMDERIILSAGYTFSDFDIYGGSRNITVEGSKLLLPKACMMHSVFVSIGVRF